VGGRAFGQAPSGWQTPRSDDLEDADVDVTVYTARTPIAMVLMTSSTLNGMPPRTRLSVSVARS
jgi:hypothetical protein